MAPQEPLVSILFLQATLVRLLQPATSLAPAVQRSLILEPSMALHSLAVHFQEVQSQAGRSQAAPTQQLGRRLQLITQQQLDLDTHSTSVMVRTPSSH